MHRHRSFLIPHGVALALFLASALGAATPFTLRFGASGSMAIDMDPPDDPDGLTLCQLGFREGALAGLDAYDVPRPSLAPPGGQAILYFPAAAPVDGLSQDFRPPAVSHAWQMELAGMAPGSSVTLQWRLQDGSLDGNPLSLVDRRSGATLVADMAATSSYVFTGVDRSLLVLYSGANHPPLARGDKAAALRADGALAIPFDVLLENDFDPDAGDTVEVVAVGSPFVPPGSGSDPADYGTTAIDADTRTITYTLPVSPPADWDGIVYVPYTIRDSSLDPATPHEASAEIEITVAPHVLVRPASAHAIVAPGTPVTVAYTLAYSGSLHSLAVAFALPVAGSGLQAAPWPYGGSYADNAAGTPDPAIDTGIGSDGLWGTDDDTGVLVLDFGTAVPPSGTQFALTLDAPANAVDADLHSVASYTVTEADPAVSTQVLPTVALRAVFEISFGVLGNGALNGATAQTVRYLDSATPVLAVPADGQYFSQWTDGSTVNPRTVTGVTASAVYTAEFLPLIPCEPNGDFELGYPDESDAALCRIWDLTGHYTTTVDGYVLSLDLVHDEKGALTGAGRLQGNLGGQPVDVDAMVFKGSGKGKAGIVTVKGSLVGANATTTASLKLSLTLAGLDLTGTIAGKLSDAAGGKDTLAGACAMALPCGMDGTYRLPVNLAQDAKGALVGTCVLTLANGRQVDLLARGKGAGTLAVLALAGDKVANPAFGAVKIKVTIQTYSNHAGDIRAVSGKAFGQSLKWSL